MDDFEKVLFSGGDVGEYIDLRSFARWLLVQDITYNDDVAGSNMYLYKDDYDESVPMSTKLKMGPLWDFDAMFRGTSYKDQWACSIHRLFSIMGNCSKMKILLKFTKKSGRQ